MQLLERYLHAVRFFLPRAQQDDIVRELEENLVAQMDDREQELGRPLTEDEHADILRQHGHPMFVAGRYRTRQVLIGPVFFPIYLLALKMGLAVCLVVTIVLATIAGIVEGSAGRDGIGPFVRGMAAFTGRGLMVFAITTLCFAVLDLMQSRLKLTGNWDPRTLPKVPNPDVALSRSGALCELLLTSFALVWVLLVPAWPSVMLGSGASILEFAPVWRGLYIPLVLLTLVSLGLPALNVMRPWWTPARSLWRIALSSGSLLIVLLLLGANEWIVARPGATLANGGSVEHVVRLVNACCEIALVVSAFVLAFQIVWEAFRIRSRRKASSSPDTAPVRAVR